MTDVRPGRWGLSQIVEEATRAFTTAAMVEGLATRIHAHYPPMNATRTAYALSVSLVRFPLGATATPSANVRLLPNLALDQTLGQLTATQRNVLRTQLEEWLQGYSFTEWDGSTRTVAAYSAAAYTTSTTIRRVLLDVLRHLAHSADRARPLRLETHNTEFLDNFATDPFAGRWTKESSDAVWDSGNAEVDAVNAAGLLALRYSVNGPGSIEHESQVTAASNGSAVGNNLAGAAVRFDDTGVNDYYHLQISGAAAVNLKRVLGGTATVLESNTALITNTAGDFYTMRLAASGAAGANVVLDYWINDHGNSKPSDPGWFGVDGTPHDTFTDTDANRLDASSHSQCGIASDANSAGNYDSRHCFWKSRAISDRGGAADTNARLIGGDLLHGGLLFGRLVQ